MRTRKQANWRRQATKRASWSAPAVSSGTQPDYATVLGMPERIEPINSPTPWVAEHIKTYVESNGADGHLWRGVPTLLLTTTGRKSGQRHRSALIYGQDSNSYCVV